MLHMRTSVFSQWKVLTGVSLSDPHINSKAVHELYVYTILRSSYVCHTSYAIFMVDSTNFVQHGDFFAFSTFACAPSISCHVICSRMITECMPIAGLAYSNPAANDRERTETPAEARVIGFPLSVRGHQTMGGAVK